MTHSQGKPCFGRTHQDCEKQPMGALCQTGLSATLILPPWMRLARQCGCAVEMATPVKDNKEKPLSVRALMLANLRNFSVFWCDRIGMALE